MLYLLHTSDTIDQDTPMSFLITFDVIHDKHIHGQLHIQWQRDNCEKLAALVSESKVLCVVVFYCRNHGLYELQKDH